MSTAFTSQPEARMGYPHILTTPTDRSIRVERVFNAPREKVWRACSEPTLIAQWWGRGNRLTIERFEFIKGGHWRFVEHSEQGDHGFEGRFREITPMDRVVQTFEWDGMPGYVIINTAEYVDLGNGNTKLIATSEFYATAERDGMLQSGMEGGMAESYAALDRLLGIL